MNEINLLRWLARKAPAMLIAAVQGQLQNRRQWQDARRMKRLKAIPTPEQEVDFLMGSIQQLYIQSDNRRLTIAHDLKKIDKLREDCKIKKGKPAPKMEFVLDLEPIILELRNNGMSWQSVSDFIAKHHKKRINRGYLQKIFADKKRQ